MLDFLNFLRSKMSEYFGFKVVKGTNADELNIKPTALLMRDFYNLLVQKQTIDNIVNWRQMTTQDMDFFGAKFFMKRIGGDVATGSVRIWVDTAQDYLISENFRAIGSDGSAYAATIPGTVRGGSLSVSTEIYGKYYFDVRVYAVSAGSSFNKTAGQITRLSGIDFDYKFVTNPRDMINGTATETNEEYKNRLQYALNDRSMCNRRSMQAGLRERFPVIHNIYIAGAGDRFMTRDLLQAVDLSQPPRQATFLGKTQADNVVKSVAFYGTFPPEPWSRGADYRNPLSIYSSYGFPQTVEAVDLANPDPAYHGYPIFQEATDDMYRGLYYDDFVRFMNVNTRDLVNVVDDIISGGGVSTPPQGWLVGAHGKNNGDFGLPQELAEQKIVQFTDLSDISISGGSARPVAAMKNILKRVGVKMSGRIVTPIVSDGGSASRSSVQVGVGAKLLSDSYINAFSGLGFGIYVIGPIDPYDTSKTNATVFFFNNSGIRSSEVYQSPDDGLGYVTAVVEQQARIAPGDEYDFEFVVNGDASLSLRLTPVYSESLGEGLSSPMLFTPAQDSSLVHDFVENSGSTAYGSYCVVAVDSGSNQVGDVWKVKRMTVVDLTPHHPHALFMFNVEGLEEPLELIFRGYGQGYSNAAMVRGHGVYIWNIETKGPIQGNTLLSGGGWERLSDVSDDNTADAVLASLTQRLSGIDRYVVNTRYGKVVIVMVVANGSSHAGLVGISDVIGDVNAVMVVDYIKLQDQQIDAFHGNHKCDIHVNTTRNVDDLKLETAALTKTLSTDYFIISAATGQAVPVADIVSVIDTDTGNLLQPSQYAISRRDDSERNSAKDVIYINAPNFSAVTVTYHTFPAVTDMQDYFDGRDFGRNIGDYMVKHKTAVYLDFGFSYSGETVESDLAFAIRQYFDENVDRVFNIDDMLNYLFVNGYVSNVSRPVVVVYETINEDGRLATGTITSQMEVSDIQFFRIRTLTPSRIG